MAPHRPRGFAQIAEKHRNRSSTQRGPGEFLWPICETKLWFRRMSWSLKLLRARTRSGPRTRTEVTRRRYWTTELCNSGTSTRGNASSFWSEVELLPWRSTGGDLLRQRRRQSWFLSLFRVFENSEMVAVGTEENFRLGIFFFLGVCVGGTGGGQENSGRVRHVSCCSKGGKRVRF